MQCGQVSVGNPDLYRVVSNGSELEEYGATLLPQLLERAIIHTRQFFRTTGHWENDVAHAKLAQRWGYELVERFLERARQEVPCRPVHLLDSFLFKHYSQPHSCSLQEHLGSPLGRFLDRLLSRAVHSRDAMTALFYHLYGMGQIHVSKILALGPAESQRVYKNYMRWRTNGWSVMIEEEGLKEEDLEDIAEQQRRHPARFEQDAAQLLHRLQTHYRKSEPPHYPCLSRAEWHTLYDGDSGRDYRDWHLSFCRPCLKEVWDLRRPVLDGGPGPRLNLHVRPLDKAAVPECE